MGRIFTWSKEEESIQASGIDKFFISSEWNDTFNNVKQLALPKVISEHISIQLESRYWGTNPSYIKFENMWLSIDGFLHRIMAWWQSYKVNGSPDFIFTQKLKLLKKNIITWNREDLEKSDAKKNKILEDIFVKQQIT